MTDLGIVDTVEGTAPPSDETVSNDPEDGDNTKADEAIKAAKPKRVIVVKREGEGTHEFEDGSVYTGGWKNNMRHGIGSYKYKSGTMYQGNWEYDDKDGDGVLQYNNGDRYTGRFKQGAMHGQGTFEHSNGDKYVGGWANNVKSGVGTFIWNDGHSWHGVWRDNNQTYDDLPEDDQATEEAKATK